MFRSADMKLSHKGLVLVSVPLLFEIAFVITLVLLLQKSDYEAWRQAHSRAVVSEVNKLTLLVYKAGENLLTFSIHKRPESLREYDSTISDFSSQLQFLRQLVSADDSRKESVANLERLADSTLDMFRRARSIVSGDKDTTPLPEFANLKDELEHTVDRLLTAINYFLDHERQLERVDPQAEGRARAMVTGCITFGVLLNIFLAAGLALFFSSEIARRLTLMVDNTNRLSREEALIEPLSGSDEIAHLDQAFHRMAAEIKELNKRKQDILNMVSHDLRSPMTAVSLALALVLKGVCGDMAPRVEKEVQLAERNTKRLLKLIDDLLDFEKMKQGKLELNKQRVSIGQLFDRSVEVLKPIADRQNITFQLDDRHLSIDADEERMIQVLVNLLSNAVKYSPANSCIQLSAEETSGCVELRVTDQGRGIAPEFCNSIFQPFEQVTGTKQSGSTGLGLTICKKIVEAHGGEIGVYSQIGCGSTFWLKIPQPESSISAAM